MHGSTQPLLFVKTSRKSIVANQSKWKYGAVRKSAKSMRHEISVDTDLDIRDDQLFENNFGFHFFENPVSIEHSLK